MEIQFYLNNYNLQNTLLTGSEIFVQVLNGRHNFFCRPATFFVAHKKLCTQLPIHENENTHREIERAKMHLMSFSSMSLKVKCFKMKVLLFFFCICTMQLIKC